MIVLMLAKKQDVKRLNSFIGYREKRVAINLFYLRLTSKWQPPAMSE